MAYKFEALTKEKSKIVFICMDTMYKIQRTWTKELIKNIADYQVQNITSSGYDLLTAITEENGLKQCEKDYTHAVVYTCLLYTSPRPRDATLSRMPSSA